MYLSARIEEAFRHELKFSIQMPCCFISLIFVNGRKNASMRRTDRYKMCPYLEKNTTKTIDPYLELASY